MLTCSAVCLHKHDQKARVAQNAKNNLFNSSLKIICCKCKITGLPDIEKQKK